MTTGAQLLVDRLLDWGVEVVFGLPGDGINGLMEALRVRRERIRFIQVRHEESAAFAAVGYAKFSGRLGVCLATSGPGAIHLLNGLYDAKMDRVPVLAITGSTYHDLIGLGYQQDVNADYLYQDVAIFNQRVMGARHVANLLDTGIRTALARGGVAHLTFPNDLQEQALDTDAASMMNRVGHSTVGWSRSESAPPAAQLESAAAVLRGCRRIVIMAGSGARGAAGEIGAVAEKLGAVVVKPLLGKDVLPDDHPHCVGGVGLLGTRPATEALESADGLLIVGSTFPYMSFYPPPGQARTVQVDIDGSRIGLRTPVDVGIVGDSRTVLEQLLPLLPTNPDRAFLDEARAAMHSWRELLTERETRTESPMKPPVLAAAVGAALRDDAIICCDTGTVTVWGARHIQVRAGQRFSASGNLASMACALPYAIGAQLAHPDRQVVCFTGDGGLSMLMAELATCVRYELPIKVVVSRNDALGMIRWEQMVFLGNPEYGTELQPIDFAKVADACGMRALTVTDPVTCHDEVAGALSQAGPVLVQGIVDPYEPMLPPKVEPAQAMHMAEALARGEPNRTRIALTMFRDSISEMGEPQSPYGVVARVKGAVDRLLGTAEDDRD